MLFLRLFVALRQYNNRVLWKIILRSGGTLLTYVQGTPRFGTKTLMFPAAVQLLSYFLLLLKNCVQVVRLNGGTEKAEPLSAKTFENIHCTLYA
jgi:hypothetical protein